jgi:hypothetical protein
MRRASSSRLFSAIVVAGATLGAGCRSRPRVIDVPSLDADVRVTSDLAFYPVADLAPTGPPDLAGCFVCPGGRYICPSPCPPTDLGNSCWPCFI